mmetsp:Transcript_15514/g.36067  ORF Transcript_15514/g.36067 Transcript_15514/m.36067 type:complete len:255 (-) Transcript_15514:639-1403(-)
MLVHVVQEVVERARGQRLHRDLLEEEVELRAALLDERGSHRPDEREDEELLNVGLLRELERHVGVERGAELPDHVDVGDRHDLLELLAHLTVDEAGEDVVDELGHVLVVECHEEQGQRNLLGIVVDLDAVAAAQPHPALVEGLVAKVLRVDPHHAAARDGGGRRVLQVKRLADHRAVRLEPDALAVGQGEEAVIVHDRVHVLHPHRVDVAVVEDPTDLVLAVLGQRLVELAEELGEDAVGPVAGDGVHDAIELV